MKKITFLLIAMLFAVGVKADELGVSTNVNKPEYLFTIKNANGNFVGSNAIDVQSSNNVTIGEFAFFAATDESGNTIDGTYYIYSYIEQKWLDYTKADSYENTKKFVSLSEKKNNYFKIVASTKRLGYYQISPYNDNGVAGKCLNYYQGVDGSNTLGLWQTGADGDAGSAFLFEKVTVIKDLADFDPTKIYSVTTVSRGGWSVNSGFCSTNDNGFGLVVNGLKPQNKFAILKRGEQDYYLYSVHEKKFVKSDKTLSDNPVSAVEFIKTTDPERFVVKFKGEEKYINIGGDKQMIIDGWNTHDEGNKVRFVEIGADPSLFSYYKYLRIKAVSGWNDDAPYLGAKNSASKESRAEFVSVSPENANEYANEYANTIFYYDGTQLLSYGSGNYLVNNNSFLGYSDEVVGAGNTIKFNAAVKAAKSTFNILFASNPNSNPNRYLYVNKNNYTDAGSGTDETDGYCFNVELLDRLPVTITGAGYASFYAPVALEIPTGVKHIILVL